MILFLDTTEEARGRLHDILNQQRVSTPAQSVWQRDAKGDD